MNKKMIRKGNLFNQLENKIDTHLIDSSQYDLEIDKKYYRIRYLASEFIAQEVHLHQFKPAKYNQKNTPTIELESFLKTDLYKETFKKQTNLKETHLKNKDNVPSYYAFLQRVTQKNNLNTSQILYEFTIPAINKRKKDGVISYDIHIELVKNRFIIVFFKENVERGYIQRREPQYMIYEKCDFEKIKSQLTNTIINYAIDQGFPLSFCEYCYIMSKGDLNFIAQIFQEINKMYSYKQFCLSPMYSLFRPNIEKCSELERDLIKYFNKEQEDINYSFNNKLLRK